MKNKFKYLIAFALFAIGLTNAQVGIGTATPDASSALEITSTDKGLLIPRMTNTQRIAISTPATGLQVYDTTTNSNWYYNGTVWVENASTADSSKWTNDPTNKQVALTNLSDGVTARPNNSKVVITDAGNVGIGITSPVDKLSVSGSLSLGINTAAKKNIIFRNKTTGGVNTNPTISSTGNGFLFSKTSTPILSEGGSFAFETCGGLNSGNPFWQGLLLMGGTINSAGSFVYPTISHYINYTTTVDPTDLFYDIAAANVGATKFNVRISSLNSGNLIFNPGTGSAGINTSSPSSLLDVRGSYVNDNKLSFFVSDNEQASSLTTLPNAFGMSITNNWVLGQGDNAFINRFANSSTVSSGFRFVQQTGTGAFKDLVYMNGHNGNVSIGTTNANANLNLKGYLRLGSSDATADVALTPGLIRYNSTTDKFEGYVNDADSVTAGNQPGWVNLN